ncbi:MAG: 1-deoxy-D-xylulose-5-phosphate reductoisomerase [Terriglobales bacterium]
MSSSAPRRLALLGSTGSIGGSTLDVLTHLRDDFQVVALSAGRNVERMCEQALAWRPELVAMADEPAAAAVRAKLAAAGFRPHVAAGAEGLRAAAAECGASIVVAATVGVAALQAIAAALATGCRLALANKEALVAAGPVLLAIAHHSGSEILPVDSEHSAIHQCLRSGAASEVAQLVLTASGGPFRGFSLAQLESVTPAAALRHPTWNMGARISLDSATLMNKGFEILEASYLFGLPEDRIRVLVHPQSIVHSLVEFHDGSVVAQLGTVDMRTPIQYALTYPHRSPSSRKRLKLEQIGHLDFELPDGNAFPCLELARQAGRAGGGAGAILNAADETALEEFVAGRIGFPAIAAVVEETLQRLGAPPVESIEAVRELDRRARVAAREAAAALRLVGR